MGTEQRISKMQPALSADPQNDYLELSQYVGIVGGEAAYLSKKVTPNALYQSWADLIIHADWNASGGTSQILNKPTLAAVATSGAYADLSGKPTIPAAQVNTDWNSSSGLSQLLNKPPVSVVNSSNLAFGAGNLGAITTGTNNVAIGTNAADALTTGNYSVAIGYQALGSQVSFALSSFDPSLLNTNIAIGPNALASTQVSWGNVAIGRNTLENLGNNPSTIGSPDFLTACYNVAIGDQAGQSVTTGCENMVIGNHTGMYITTGNCNTAMGSETLKNCTTGLSNTAYGVSALQGLTTGSHNTACGEGAGGLQQDPTCTTTGTYNTFLGSLVGNASVSTTAASTVAPGAPSFTVADASKLALGMLIGNATTYLTANPFLPNTVIVGIVGTTIYVSTTISAAITTGDTIVAWGNPVLNATSAPTSSGNVLTFTSVPSSIQAGMLAVNLASSATIPTGTTVTSTSSTTVHLSSNVAMTVNAGNTIGFVFPKTDYMTLVGSGATGYRNNTVFLGRAQDSVIIGGPGVTATAALSIDASSATRAAINLAASAPASPVNGDIWVNASGFNAYFGGETFLLNSVVPYTAPPTGGYTPNGGNIWIGTTVGNVTLAPSSSVNQASFNTAVGISCGQSLTTGYNNTFLGQSNGILVNSGYGNTIAGYNNGLALTGGYNNSLFGSQLGNSMAGGYLNVLVGYYCGAGITSGFYNTLIGTSVGNAIVSASGNVMIGNSTGTGVTSSANTIIGYATGGGITSGANNTIIGANIGSLSNYSNAIIIADGGGNRRFNADSNGNIGLNGYDQYGSGAGVVFLANAGTAPTTNPTGGGILYSTAGSLYWRDSSGNTNSMIPAAVTGYGTPTGGAKTSSYAAYAGQTYTGSYVQATCQATDDAVKKLGQMFAQLVVDLKTQRILAS